MQGPGAGDSGDGVGTGLLTSLDLKGWGWEEWLLAEKSMRRGLSERTQAAAAWKDESWG